MSVVRSLSSTSLYSPYDSRAVDISEVMPGQLYQSSLDVATDLKLLKVYNIRFVVNVTTDAECMFRPDIEYLHVPIPDEPSAPVHLHFEAAYDFIDRAIGSGSAVLVHCYAGISRSSTVVVSYLMRKHRLTLRDALHRLRTARTAAHPNIGFLLQLKRLEDQLREHPARTASELVAAVLHEHGELDAQLVADDLAAHGHELSSASDLTALAEFANQAMMRIWRRDRQLREARTAPFAALLASQGPV